MKKDELYDLCWRYMFVSDAIECLKGKKERRVDFCYVPFYVRDMSDKVKKKIIQQGKKELEKIRQQILEASI